MIDIQSFKAINFDLDTNKLKEKFENYTQAYNDVRKAFHKQGFEHRQGSGYVSDHPVTNLDVYVCVINIMIELNWLPNCVKKFDVTDIGDTYDMTDIIHNFEVNETFSDKLPQSMRDKLATYQRDNRLRGEVAATQTLNDILDRPFNSTVKVNTAQSKKASDTAAKRSKKSKGKSKA